MIGMHPDEELISELVQRFRVTYGGINAEFHMAEELIQLARELDRLEAENKILRDDWHSAFHRQCRRV